MLIYPRTKALWPLFGYRSSGRLHANNLSYPPTISTYLSLCRNSQSCQKYGLNAEPNKPISKRSKQRIKQRINVQTRRQL